MKTDPLPFPVPGDESVPPEWRWHHRVLLSLRRHLLDEGRMRRADAAEPIEPHTLHEADSATDEFEHDMACALWRSNERALEEVDAALARIRNRRYGICEATGMKIPAERLRAVPWCRYSLGAERAIERTRPAAPQLPKLMSLRGRGRDIPQTGVTTRLNSEGPNPEPVEPDERMASAEGDEDGDGSEDPDR